MEPHVCIVDDEKNIRETLTYTLEKEGYRVSSFPDGLSAWESFQQALPDVIILDIIMPRMDGLELCRKVRTLSERVNILFLSSKDDEFDRVLGLQIGGDDYLCKPFSVRELSARIQVMLRRIQALSRNSDEEKVLTQGDLILDLNRYSALWKENPLPLTITEFLLLHALVQYPGHIKTRDQLIDAAYSQNTYVNDRTIDTHIKRLRKKFNHCDPEFSGIETVYGMGYRYR